MPSPPSCRRDHAKNGVDWRINAAEAFQIPAPPGADGNSPARSRSEHCEQGQVPGKLKEQQSPALSGTSEKYLLTKKNRWALAPILVKRTRWSLSGNQSPTCPRTGVLSLTENSGRCSNSGKINALISTKAGLSL